MADPVLVRTLLQSLPANARLLIVAAAPSEASAIAGAFGIEPPIAHPSWAPQPLSARVDLVVSGVGKAAAAAAVAAALAADPARGGVLNIGLAGALPPNAPPLLSRVIASAHHFADEGVALPAGRGFTAMHELGFCPDGALQDAVAGDPAWITILRRALPDALLAPIATVSTCSGRDDLASAVAARTHAAAEAMEGAAVALAARRAGIPYAEIRILSNTTGDRHAQVWRIKDALAEITRTLGGA